MIHMAIRRPIPCFVCGKELDPVIKVDDDQRQPWGATQFFTYGNFGSTVFDEVDGSQLRINICDDHLLERRDRVYHSLYIDLPKHEQYYRPWEPQEQDG